MRAEFDITLHSSDLYRFSMYHAYAGGQGIVSTVVAAICFIASILTYGSVEKTYTVLYAGFGVLFLFYIPCSLYLRSKRQLLLSKPLQEALHYVVDDIGIHTSQGDAFADLPWDGLYKAVSTKRSVFLYSSRVNAYIIPRDQLGEAYGTVKSLAAAHLPNYRLKMK